MIRIFDQTPEWGGNKVNFVDHNNVLLGYDLEQDCCEDAFWAVSGESEYSTDMKRVNKFDLSAYKFHEDYVVERYFIEGAEIATFKITAFDRQDLYIHLINVHNGYYGHTFVLSTPTKEDCL